VTSLLIAPSVTPWETTLPGVLGGAGNNPSIRLVQYSRQNGSVLDIEQYYLNLTAANAVADDDWTLTYRFTDYYQLPDVSSMSLGQLAQALWTDDNQFDRYYRVNDAFYEPEVGGAWSRDERVVQWCAVTQMNYTRYDDCVKTNMAIGGAVTVSSPTRLILLISIISTSVFLTLGIE
jgi:sphingomyelin phosphodiesterase acid-like 3